MCTVVHSKKTRGVGQYLVHLVDLLAYGPVLSLSHSKCLTGSIALIPSWYADPLMVR